MTATTDPEAFSVVALENGCNYVGLVYLGVEEVFENIEPKTSYPAGIEDFASYTLRIFARRLRALLSNE